MENYRHDCDQCTFLGQFNEHDLYYCGQHGIPTVIARFGDMGSEYYSGLAIADQIPALAEAKKRAKEMGFLGEVGDPWENTWGNNGK